ncbi:MptD family putative ECF transporter S component [Mageeibacillus indolicus]|uniref:MptD family putative ECF transporter S component n=1 Tax=Mageeibacillus indolicus TaxID=884684 RepID=UPI0006904AC3|nr:MptD family putative ECF transporter S component [Mageeibacillus indolicus]
MFTSIKRLAKDSGLILLGTVIYFVLSVIGMIVAPLFGPFGEAVSPGITGVFTGSVFFFLSRRVGRLGQFTVVSLITMCVYSLMGGMYLPWFISVVVMSVLADWLASRGKQVPVWQVAIAAGMVNIGSVFGAVIPCWFFMQSYRDYWLAHNETVETMDKVIKYTSGLMGLVTTLVTFALSVIGVYIVYLIWLGCSKAWALKRARVAQTSAVADGAVAESAVADGAVAESAVADDAAEESAVADGAAEESAAADDAAEESAVTDDAVVDGAAEESAVADDAAEESAVADGAVADDAVVDCAAEESAVADDAAEESAVADGAVADSAVEESAVADGAVTDDTAKRIAAPQIVRIPPDNAMPKIVRIKTTDTERPNPPEMPQETPDRLIIHPKHLDQ